MWPLPLARPILAGIAPPSARALAGVRPLRVAPSLPSAHLVAADRGTAAAVFGAGPTTLVCLLTAVVITFAVVAAIVLVASLLADGGQSPA